MSRAKINGMSITFTCPNTGEESTSWSSRYQLDLRENMTGIYPVLLVWVRCQRCGQDHELEFTHLIQVEKSFVLTLDEEEALVVRNSLEYTNPDWVGDEPPSHTEIRESIYQTLNSFLEED